MSASILKSGIICLSSTIFYPHVKQYDIYIRQSPVWTSAVLSLNDVNFFYRFPENRNHEINIKKINDLNSLLINNMIVYQNKNLFNYTIDISLNQDININKEYANFYKVMEVKANATNIHHDIIYNALNKN